MNDKLIYLLKKYGTDFFAKLPRYKTAKHEAKYVSLLRYYPDTLTFDIGWEENSQEKTVNIFELDDYCL